MLLSHQFISEIALCNINPSCGAGFTLATYTHATNKVQEQAAKMGNLLKQAL